MEPPTTVKFVEASMFPGHRLVFKGLFWQFPPLELQKASQIPEGSQGILSVDPQ